MRFCSGKSRCIGACGTARRASIAPSVATAYRPTLPPSALELTQITRYVHPPFPTPRFAPPTTHTEPRPARPRGDADAGCSGGGAGWLCSGRARAEPEGAPVLLSVGVRCCRRAPQRVLPAGAHGERGAGGPGGEARANRLAPQPRLRRARRGRLRRRLRLGTDADAGPIGTWRKIRARRRPALPQPPPSRAGESEPRKRGAASAAAAGRSGARQRRRWRPSTCRGPCWASAASAASGPGGVPERGSQECSARSPSRVALGQLCLTLAEKNQEWKKLALHSPNSSWPPCPAGAA